jgi:DNA-binding NtrC family response regulator
MPSLSILVVEDEANLRTVLASHLAKLGHSVETARDGGQALEFLGERSFDLVLTDLRMPVLDGLGLMDRSRAVAPDTLFIVITAHATIENAIGALRRGAHDYVTKPFDLDQITAAVSKAAGHVKGLRAEVSRAPEEAAQSFFQKIVGQTEAMQKVQRTAQQAATSDSTVLVHGESGTGKELLARMIHDLSPRRGGPYVVVNCAALPENLIEAELFGFERGAFTGAVERKPGRFELAHGGTIFLDEVGEIPGHLQAKLLRVLQTREFERIGGIQSVVADARVVAATHRDLLQEVREGRFRHDLYYRLNVVPIGIPPLRERVDDIPSLAECLLARLRARTRRSVSRLSPESLHLMKKYPWPGNVRELENVLERAMVLSAGDVITPGDLPPELVEAAGAGQAPISAAAPAKASPPAGSTSQPGLKRTVRESRAQMEKELILEALKKTRWNRTRAAELLGISRRSLHTKIVAYHLDRDDEGAR